MPQGKKARESKLFRRRMQRLYPKAAGKRRAAVAAIRRGRPNRGLCNCPPDTRGNACNGTCHG